ncbi:MAG: glycosyltransferase [Chitinophagaceae bacterium]|nr:glycosyltransferase [Chitinophagaceae bacterium]
MADRNIHPKVSIIISSYNGAKYIAETIESVSHQTYQNWELIIVDDGSIDHTCEIVAGIKDERIRLYEAGRVGINGKIKNIGLDKATGELIAFIDHDDLWHPSKLEKQIAALQKYPEAGFCLTGGYNFKTKGEPIEYYYKQREGIRFDNIFLSIFRSEIGVWTQALLVRKQCIEATGPFSETSLFADPEFIYRLSYNFKAVLLYEPLMYRRVHDTNYSLVNWEVSHKEGIDVFKSYRDKKMLPQKLAKEVLFRSYLNFGEKYLKYKKRRKAAKNFGKAWRYKPFSIVPAKKIAKAFLYFLKGK